LIYDANTSSTTTTTSALDFVQELQDFSKIIFNLSELNKTQYYDGA